MKTNNKLKDKIKENADKKNIIGDYSFIIVIAMIIITINSLKIK